MSQKFDYEKIMSDRKLFNETVYTPLSEALKLLNERRKDLELVTKIEKLLDGNIPEILKNKNKYAILFRQVATPNHEIRIFTAIAKEFDLHPVFFEYHDDKFTSNNNYKHSLGQLRIQNKGVTKEGDSIFEKITIVDFNKYNGEKLNKVVTLWGEPLVDFHKFLFKEQFKDDIITTWDASDLYKKQGANNPFDLYKYLFLFFIYHGILFENFLTSKDKEGDFTSNVILPAIENTINLTGVKPLITPIGPLEIETDDLWYNHLSKVKEIINERKNIEN